MLTSLPHLHLALTLALSVALALYLTPMVRKGALRFGVLDVPDGRLKRQPEPVPYLGGVAVYLAFLVTLALVFEFDAHLLGLLLGGTMMVMLGLFDDMKVLPPGVKLVGQCLAALVLVKSDVWIQLEVLPVWINAPLTVVWLVGVTNAVNILDVSDGLAAGTSAVAALALGAVALMNGDLLIATTAVALAGSLAGFLRFNRPPARIYLGDAGSLFVGFMLAALSMIGAYTRQSLVAAAAPLAILFVPLFEIGLVTLARLSRGIAPWRGSPDHFALRLRARGWPAGRVAVAAAAVSAASGAAAIVMVTATALVAALLVATLAAFAALLVAWLWRVPRKQRAAADIGPVAGAR